MIFLPVIFTLLTLYIASNINRIKIWWLERRRRIELAEKIPGPKALPIFGNALSFMGTSDDSRKKLDEESAIAFKNNEPLRRYWIGDMLLIHGLSSEATKVIYDSTTEISKGRSYNFLSRWLGDGLLISDGDKWKGRRRLLTPTFHFNMLKRYFEAYNTESRLMVKSFEKFAESGEEVEIFNIVKRMSLDIICDTAMGVKINTIDKPNNPYLLAVEKYAKLGGRHFRSIFYKIPIIYYLFGDGFERDKTLSILKSFTQSIIKQKTLEFENNNGELHDNTFLSNLLQLKQENKWTDEDVREEVETFMFAGHDTTSSLVSYLWWALACNQDIQEKVYEEIYDVFGEEERDVLPEDLPKLNYTDMVIKETLRRYSIVPYFNRGIANEIEVCGYVIPKGAIFVFPLQHTNYNPKVFPDPYKFDPNRFLPENVAKRNAYDFTPFSAGPRNCIGQRFALNETKTVLVWILRRYKLTTKRNEDYVKSVPDIIQTPTTGIPIIFVKRNV
uniref:Cytochrome P450 4V2 (inferred by orthology to a human protein) n=1 Tax=Strongyloides venezuelensis TaxID=75913 RepID=A0A0K0FEI4_STRVS